jgi:hypothetical protein
MQRAAQLSPWRVHGLQFVGEMFLAGELYAAGDVANGTILAAEAAPKNPNLAPATNPTPGTGRRLRLLDA